MMSSLLMFSIVQFRISIRFDEILCRVNHLWLLGLMLPKSMRREVNEQIGR